MKQYNVFYQSPTQTLIGSVCIFFIQATHRDSAVKLANKFLSNEGRKFKVQIREIASQEDVALYSLEFAGHRGLPTMTDISLDWGSNRIEPKVVRSASGC